MANREIDHILFYFLGSLSVMVVFCFEIFFVVLYDALTLMKSPNAQTEMRHFLESCNQ